MKDTDDYEYVIDLGLEVPKEDSSLVFADDREEELGLLERKIQEKRKELEMLEVKCKYYGGFRKYLYTYLNKTYHTLILIGFMFLGYTITGFKTIGIRIWKAPTSIIFYILFTVGFSLLSFFEYVKNKNEE